MNRTRILCCLMLGAGLAEAASRSALLPTDDGVTWEYDVAKQTGNGPVAHITLTFRVAGREMVEGHELVRFETASDGQTTRTELFQADDDGVVNVAEIAGDGKVIKREPPRILLRTPLSVGATWESAEEREGKAVRTHCRLEESENLTLPGGTFRAYRIHSEDAPSGSITADRWFVPGTGFVKEVIVTRTGPQGAVERITRELRGEPRVVAVAPIPLPSASTSPAPPAPEKPFRVDASDKPSAAAKTVFPVATENIYIRWDGHDLRKGAELRAVWIAEDVGGIVEPNFVIDQLSALIATAESHGRFTLSRPKDGWAPGKYRLEVYLDDALAETLKLTIGR